MYEIDLFGIAIQMSPREGSSLFIIEISEANSAKFNQVRSMGGR